MEWTTRQRHGQIVLQVWKLYANELSPLLCKNYLNLLKWSLHGQNCTRLGDRHAENRHVRVDLKIESQRDKSWRKKCVFSYFLSRVLTYSDISPSTAIHLRQRRYWRRYIAVVKTPYFKIRWICQGAQMLRQCVPCVWERTFSELGALPWQCKVRVDDVDRCDRKVSGMSNRRRCRRHSLRQ